MNKCCITISLIILHFILYPPLAMAYEREYMSEKQSVIEKNNPFPDTTLNAQQPTYTTNTITTDHWKIGISQPIVSANPKQRTIQQMLYAATYTQNELLRAKALKQLVAQLTVQDTSTQFLTDTMNDPYTNTEIRVTALYSLMANDTLMHNTQIRTQIILRLQDPEIQRILISYSDTAFMKDFLNRLHTLGDTKQNSFTRIPQKDRLLFLGIAAYLTPTNKSPS